MITGNKYLQRVLFLSTRVAKNYEFFKDFYDKLVERDKNAVIVTYALACKLTVVVYHVLKDGVYKGVVKKSRLLKRKGAESDKYNVKSAFDSSYSQFCQGDSGNACNQQRI